MSFFRDLTSAKSTLEKFQLEIEHLNSSNAGLKIQVSNGNKNAETIMVRIIKKINSTFKFHFS